MPESNKLAFDGNEDKIQPIGEKITHEIAHKLVCI
jgi:hypothetical protein